VGGVQDRVVIITGAAGGLGKQYAVLFGKEGARVVVNDLGTSLHGEGSENAAADAVCAEIAAAGGTAVPNYDSVATKAGAEAIVETALDAFGRVDAVVHNAGIIRDVTIQKMEEEQWDAVLRTHLYGAYYLAHAAWPHFREQGHGRFVVTSSSAGLFGNFGQTNYAAAKLGLVGFINTLALEGARYGIKANAISPAGATRMTMSAMNEERRAQMDPAWVAPAVVYLCSDELQESGVIIRAFGGRYQRVALIQSQGVEFAEIPSVAQLAAQWDKVLDMTHGKVGGAVGQM
jgi:NAD(P)-dependent dehydrogenase (short-subunit alcohol dehydrogenase family)